MLRKMIAGEYFNGILTANFLNWKCFLSENVNIYKVMGFFFSSISLSLAQK